MIPGIAPAAKQEGQYVAKLIQSRLKDEKPVLKPFRYRHQGVGDHRSPDWLWLIWDG
jgi:NADH dehydrogenase